MLQCPRTEGTTCADHVEREGIISSFNFVLLEKSSWRSGMSGRRTALGKSSEMSQSVL